jgi:MFS family permease
MLGGFFTDMLGYEVTMCLHASLTLVGAIIALFFLPETAGIRKGSLETRVDPLEQQPSSRTNRRREFVHAAALYGVNRFVIPGILISTFGLFLFEKFGDSVGIAGRTLGVATLTGVGLGVSTLVSMLSAPVIGTISDRVSNRWKTVTGGLIPGIAGFSFLALGSPSLITLGIPLISLTSGSNQGLATTLVGDTSAGRRHSRELGVLFTIGDLMSAAGPMVAYALLPMISISGLYIMAAVLFGGMFFVALRLGFSRKPL